VAVAWGALGGSETGGSRAFVGSAVGVAVAVAVALALGVAVGCEALSRGVAPGTQAVPSRRNAAARMAGLIARS
jgi:hypothetical protein